MFVQSLILDWLSHTAESLALYQAAWSGEIEAMRPEDFGVRPCGLKSWLYHMLFYPLEHP